jgi:hypothetical protein
VVTLPHAVFGDGRGDPRGQKLVFGVDLKAGKVVSGLHGYGIRGTVEDAGSRAGQCSFRVKVEFAEETFRRGTGRAEYRVILARRKGRHVTGSYRGVHGRRAAQGPVSAWIDEG